MDYERFKAWRDMFLSVLLFAFVLFGIVGYIVGAFLFSLGVPIWVCCVLGVLCTVGFGLALLCEFGASLQRKLH